MFLEQLFLTGSKYNNIQGWSTVDSNVLNFQLLLPREISKTTNWRLSNHQIFLEVTKSLNIQITFASDKIFRWPQQNTKILIWFKQIKTQKHFKAAHFWKVCIFETKSKSNENQDCCRSKKRQIFMIACSHVHMSILKFDEISRWILFTT